MSATQLELWNDTPDPWQRKMEMEAFKIAFPGEELHDGDKVFVNLNYTAADPGYRYSSWTWDEGTDAYFAIEVRWIPKWRDKLRVGQPVNRVYFGVVDPAPRSVVYSAAEAREFWMKLMRSSDAR